MPLIEQITTAHDRWEFEPTARKIPRDEYRSIPALNPSAIVEGISGYHNPDPSAVKLSFTKDDSRPRTQASQDSMDLGTLAHLMILEPHRVADDVAIWEGGQRRGAQWDAFEHENRDKLIIRRADFDEVQTGSMIVSGCQYVRDLLADVEIELSVFSQFQSIYTKGLIDAATHRQKPRIVDLKTTERGISDHAVEKTIRDMRYREKMACYRRWYADAIAERPENIEVTLIFAKLTPPYGVNIRKLTDDGLAWGWQQCVEVMESVERCLQSDDWPVWFSHGATGLSSWEIRELEEMIGGNE